MYTSPPRKSRRHRLQLLLDAVDDVLVLALRGGAADGGHGDLLDAGLLEGRTSPGSSGAERRPQPEGRTFEVTRAHRAGTASPRVASPSVHIEATNGPWCHRPMRFSIFFPSGAFRHGSRAWDLHGEADSRNGGPQPRAWASTAPAGSLDSSGHGCPPGAQEPSTAPQGAPGAPRQVTAQLDKEAHRHPARGPGSCPRSYRQPSRGHPRAPRGSPGLSLQDTAGLPQGRSASTDGAVSSHCRLARQLAEWLSTALVIMKNAPHVGDVRIPITGFIVPIAAPQPRRGGPRLRTGKHRLSSDPSLATSTGHRPRIRAPPVAAGAAQPGPASHRVLALATNPREQALGPR